MDMNDSLQQQLYMSMGYSGLGQQSIDSSHAQYVAMQQQLRNMQMQQSIPVVGGPMNFVQSIPNSVNNFMAGQMAGIQSGYGITPPVMNAFNQYVGAPVANQVGQTVGLGSAMFTTLTSQRMAALNYEQKTDLAAALSRGTMNTALTAAGAVGSVGAMVGGIALGGTGLALGLGKFVAQGLTTSKFVNSLFGGSALTGWNPDVWSPVKFAKQELARDDDFSSFLHDESYRFISPSVGRTTHGTGLTRKQSQQWANRVRRFDTKFNLTTEESDALVHSVIDNGLVNNVTDLDDFEQRFGKQVGYIKNASKILNKSIQEVSDMMGELKQAGFSVENFDLKAAELKNYASLLGKNIDVVKSFMVNSAKAYTQGTAINIDTAADQMLLDASGVKYIEDKAKREKDVQTYSRIANNGGPEGTAAVAYGGIKNIFSGSMGMGLAAAFFREAEPGKLEFNRDAFEAAYNEVLSGQTRASDYTTQGAARLTTWTPALMKDFYDNPTNYVLNLDEVSRNKLTRMAVEIYRPVVGKDATLSQLAQNFGGVDNNAALAIQDVLNGFDAAGARTAVSNTFLPYETRYTAMMEVMAEDRQKKGYSASTSVGRFWSDLFVNSKQNLENAIMDRLNRKGGLPPEDILQHQVSSVNYNMSLATWKENDELTAAAEKNMNESIIKLINAGGTSYDTRGKDITANMSKLMSMMKATKSNFYKNNIDAYEDLLDEFNNFMHVKQAREDDLTKYSFKSLATGLGTILESGTKYSSDEKDLEKSIGAFNDATSMTERSAKFIGILDVLSENDPRKRWDIVKDMRASVSQNADDILKALVNMDQSDPTVIGVRDELTRVKAQATEAKTEDIFPLLASLAQLTEKVGMGTAEGEGELDEKIKSYPDRLKEYYDIIETALDDINSRIGDSRWSKYGIVSSGGGAMQQRTGAGMRAGMYTP